jgi:N-acetylmuramoyl-L-alanine amidase
MAKKVYIGVGHGGSDPGACANGLKEKNLTLSIALACQDELARHGVLVKMSRTKDETDSVAAKVSECNKFGPDLALDIHINAGGGDGAEVFHSINGGTGKTLAKNILAEIVKTGQNSRGTKTKKNSSGSDYFGFIRSINCPSIIVECAFIDTKKDIQIIDTKAEQVAMGVAIAKGILKTLGIAYKAQETPKEEPKKEDTGKIYRVQVGAYSVKANAEAMQKKLKAAGYDAIIV